MNDEIPLYDHNFFKEQVSSSIVSARNIVPKIIALHPAPQSVVDVGCGTGSWLREYIKAGITDVLGVDGYLPDDSLLLIAGNKTVHYDLAHPFKLERRFDIAQSLEVVEHLPTDAAAIFVESLIGLSDLVIFGAAIPGQGGTNHINEQWQSYWSTLFAQHGYILVEGLRPEIWHDENVAWWYAQNTLVYVNSHNNVLIEHVKRITSPHKLLLDVVHPRCYRQYLDELASAQQELASAQQELASAQQELASAQQELASAQQELASVQQELASVQQELASAQQELASAQQSEDQLFALLNAVPSRFHNVKYIERLCGDQRSLMNVICQHPKRLTYWFDLRRLRRRRLRD